MIFEKFDTKRKKVNPVELDIQKLREFINAVPIQYKGPESRFTQSNDKKGPNSPGERKNSSNAIAEENNKQVQSRK